MGLVFEDICRQWFYEMAKKNALPFFTGSLGRWWGPNPETRKQEEIDIMSSRSYAALFAECKWKNTATGTEAYHDLKRKSGMFSFNENHYYILTKTPPTSELQKLDREQGIVKCYSLQKMIDELVV